MDRACFRSSFPPPDVCMKPSARAECHPTFDLQASYQCPHSAAHSFSPLPFLQHVVASSDASRLCISSSSRSLIVFDPRTFQPVDTRHETHASQITEISFLSLSPCLLASSSQDGTLRLWDFRLSSSASASPCVGTLRLAPPGSTEAEVWSVAVNSSDRLIAGGCKNSFFLFDLRKSLLPPLSSSVSHPPRPHENGPGPFWEANSQTSAPSCEPVVRRGKKKRKQKGERAEVGPQEALGRVAVHSDTVTCLRFHPWLDSILFSGGEDHLVCIHDLSHGKLHSSSSSSRQSSSPSRLIAEDPGGDNTNITKSGSPGGLYVRDEEEEGELTMVSCFSHGRPVKKLSVLGPQDDCLCVASPMEDVALWQLSGLSSGRHRLRSGEDSLREAEEGSGMEAETGWADPEKRPQRTSDHLNGAAVGRQEEEEDSVAWVNHIEKKADWSDLRSQPSIVCGESGGYLVDSFYDEGSGRLFFLAGSVSGHLDLFHANLDGLVPAATFTAPFGQQAHTAVVRDAATVPLCSSTANRSAPYGSSATPWAAYPSCLLVTCGEDGRLCGWKQKQSASLQNSLGSFGKCADLSMKNHRWPKGCVDQKSAVKRRGHFYAPY